MIDKTESVPTLLRKAMLDRLRLVVYVLHSCFRELDSTTTTLCNSFPPFLPLLQTLSIWQNLFGHLGLIRVEHEHGRLTMAFWKDIN